ncbi:MAG: Gfo/Idh/MocA family oxidoreductase [Lachnospiraceae bacterium]|nr:Gfo/Idh/MocA family oxidoreductase [Lachnospiraceae bacterium]
MKLGILGNGMIVKDLMKTIHKLNFEKIHVLGREASREKVEQLVREHQLTGSYYDYETMLQSDVDVIYVALPNHLHYDFAGKALKHKKHVILEKPAASSGEEMRELAELAGNQKRMLFEAMNIHYLPAFQALKEDLAKLGEIKMVSLNYSQYSSRYDAFKQGTVLPAFDPRMSGGALMDINVYNVHAVMGLFGVPKRARYYANVERGIDTSGMMFYDYGTFKAVSIGAKDCRAPIVSTIQGNQAALVIEKPVNHMTEYRILYNDGHEELRSFDQTEHRMYYEFAAFIRMIEEEDFETCQKMLELSCEAAELMTRTRREEGIIFAAD